MEIGIVLWLCFGIVGAMIGNRKGSGCAGFALGIILGPIGLLIALVMKGARVTCPFCKELINKGAIVCPKCQRDQLPKNSQK